MGLIFRAVGWLGLWVVLIVAGFLGYATLVEYAPDEVEDIAVFGEAQTLDKDTIRLLSWNIGYCGLGSDMDFFMDGGESSRTSRGRTLQNLEGIATLLHDMSDSLDFILLQEVDIQSKRGYGINSYDTITERLGLDFNGYFARNFSTFYVPIPITDPIGQVDAGMAIFSRYSALSAERLAYPNPAAWPMSMFDLKRCMLSLKIKMADSTYLYVNNTHNSAYDDGDGRANELKFINKYLAEKEYSITAGDWNSVPPGYVISEAQSNDEFFQVQRTEREDMPEGFHFATDISKHSARYGYEPFNAQSTTQTLIDYAVTSPKVKPIKIEYLDLGYEYSDHNPVVFTFVIQK